MFDQNIVKPFRSYESASCVRYESGVGVCRIGILLTLFNRYEGAHGVCLLKVLFTLYKDMRALGVLACLGFC